MYFLPGSIAVLAFFTLAKSQDPTPLPIAAKVTVHSGEVRLFSGEEVQLTCSVPDDPAAKWSYHWFKDGNLLKTLEVYDLKNAAVWQGGNYTCQGEKEIDTWPYSLKTLISEPLSLQVDGGWALLRVPAEPLLINEATILTCRIRDDPMLVEVIFYKDGVEILKKKDKNLEFTSLTLMDQGSYSCRATWLQKYDYHSAQSLPAFVTVLDKLSTPELQFQPKSPVTKGKDVVLRCVTQLNVREKGHNIEYYFYKDEDRMAPSSPEETYTIPRVAEEDAGMYACRAFVRTLKLERWSALVELKVKK
ncbi:high affinity immunoglobulin gamma Fc receptor I-like [Salminus brasiliensis]|uniref:high affinity immunoglobulin gamma Fc receptor I-like n=1 Tax=Salminus brasiliensis TaxID=930266 RepID=UPI003B838203